MLKVEKAIAFTLDDGSHIQIRTDGNGEEGRPMRREDWKALDVSLVTADGKEEVLCSVEYDGRIGLRTLVFDKEHRDPVFVQENGAKGVEK